MGDFFKGTNMSCTTDELNALTADLENISYTLEDLTQETLEGAGVFDVLMRALENHLEREHAANRITGDQYAATYTQLTSTVLQQSIQFILGLGKLQLENSLTILQNEKLKKEIQLLCQRLVTEKAQVMDNTVLDPTANDNETYQDPVTGALYNQTIQNIQGTTGRKNNILSRQAKGYDDDYKTKASQLILDAYKIIYSNITDTGAFPYELRNPAIDHLIEHLKMDTKIVTDKSSDTVRDNEGEIRDDQLSYSSQAED